MKNACPGRGTSAQIRGIAGTPAGVRKEASPTGGVAKNAPPPATCGDPSRDQKDHAAQTVIHSQLLRDQSTVPSSQPCRTPLRCSPCLANSRSPLLLYDKRLC